ncbi:5-methyltetrahydropteroyltriglutamate--homocysteine S-methyltransferase, partial [Streptomyces sp. SID7803]|nr:5-methyltetrahydropteroyltriglutamate--homocysteine S-methyltransferase [Streptomyces sp. SID7803]
MTSWAGRRTHQTARPRFGAGVVAVRFVLPFALSSRRRDFRDSSREGDLRDSEVRSRGSTGHRVRLPPPGPNRELKKAIEAYWKGRVTADASGRQRRTCAAPTGGSSPTPASTRSPTGDFSYYDHVLDTTVMVGAIPERHRAAVA